MEKIIVADLEPVYSEMYLSPLRKNGLMVYAKELNLDGWIKSVDIFLIYDSKDQLALAEKIVSEVMNA